MTKPIHITKKGTLIKAPASKSFAQRALFAGALSTDTTVIKQIGDSDDVLHIQRIIEQLGFKLESKHQLTTISRTGGMKTNTVNVGESGLGTRLAVPLLSFFFTNYTIEGKGSLLARPMGWFKNALPQTGLTIRLTENHLPIFASGKIKAGNYSVDGSESSQYVSGLLMALPLCKGDSTLEVVHPTSIPYLDITLSVLSDFGIIITHQNHTHYTIKGNQYYQPKQASYTVEGDYSGAAFWVVYGLLNRGISISNLNPKSVQADAEILNIVEKVGGSYRWENRILTIIPPEHLLPFEFDATQCPDLFPILTTLAAGIRGQSIITGTNRLTYKESNRKLVLLEEFNKLGLEIESTNDSLIISGTGKLESGNINSNNDHRIAMAFAIASFLTPKGIGISDPFCVNKSYPAFWKTLNIL